MPQGGAPGERRCPGLLRWCALRAAQGPATKVGGGPKGHAGALALSTPPGLHEQASHSGVAGTEVPPRQKLSAPHWATGCLIKP